MQTGQCTRAGYTERAERFSKRQPVCLKLVVVLETEVGDQIFAAQMPQRVFELHQLNEDVVFGVQAGRSLGDLK